LPSLDEFELIELKEALELTDELLKLENKLLKLDDKLLKLDDKPLELEGELLEIGGELLDVELPSSRVAPLQDASAQDIAIKAIEFRMVVSCEFCDGLFYCYKQDYR
jgi:hypothetical protein